MFVVCHLCSCSFMWIFAVLFFCTAQIHLRVQIKKPELDYDLKTKPNQCFNPHVNINIMKKNICHERMNKFEVSSYILHRSKERLNKCICLPLSNLLYSLKNRFIFWGPSGNCQCLIFLDIVLFISRQVGKLCNWADVSQPKRASGGGWSQRSRWNRGISGGFLFTSAA